MKNTPAQKNGTKNVWMPRAQVVVQAACLVLAAAAGPVWALDLHQAYEAAFKNDAMIRASRAAADAARERLPQAKAQRLPNVSLTVNRNRNDLTSKTRDFLGQPVTQQNQYPSSNESLTVRQPVYRPYVGALVNQARAQVDDAEAMLETDEQSLVVRVGEAYFDALLAHNQLALMEAQKVSFITQLDAARKSLLAGSGTRTDVDEAQAQVDMARAQELEVMQSLEYTRRRLEMMTGQPVQSLADLDVQNFRPDPLLPADVQQWIGLAESTSPELQSARAQVEAARLEIDKAEAGHKPTLDVVAQWSRSNSDSVTSVNSRYDQRMIGLQLSVPLYSGGQVNSLVRQAVAAHVRAQEVQEATRLDLGMRVHKEFRSVTEGVLRIAALEQAVRSAEQAVLSNRKSFEAGSRTTLDVLNAEKQKTMALRDLAQARYVYVVSQIRLQSLAGKDKRASLEQVNAWLMH